MGSCSMSVTAKQGVATEPIRHPIRLLGIEPETIICINRQPPPSPSPAAPVESKSNDVVTILFIFYLLEKISNEDILAIHKYEIGNITWALPLYYCTHFNRSLIKSSL